MRVDPRPVRSTAEIVDLASRPVAPGRPARPGGFAVGAAAIVIVLLAAGLGVLGGRIPADAPATDAAASAAASRAAAGSVPSPRTPVVLPRQPCRVASALPPVISLVVDDQAFAAPADPPADRPSVVVPAEARTALHVEGDVCANAWQIALDGGTILDELDNPELDPAYASQNWFPLSLYDLRGQGAVLIVTLRFPQVEVTGSWSIHVGEFDPPTATLAVHDKGVAMAPGCDVQLTMRSGIVSLADPGCAAGVATALEPPVLQIAPGEDLAFALGSWDLDHGDVQCGRLEDEAFVVDPGCGPSPGNFLGTIEFPGPTALGAWTLAVSGCALEQFNAPNPNSLCGTWYATVQVSA